MPDPTPKRTALEHHIRRSSRAGRYEDMAAPTAHRPRESLSGREILDRVWAKPGEKTTTVPMETP